MKNSEEVRDQSNNVIVCHDRELLLDLLWSAPYLRPDYDDCTDKTMHPATPSVRLEVREVYNVKTLRL